MNEPISCSVCQHEITGLFCPNCGQRYKPEKITAWTTLSDLLANLFSLEKSVAAVCLKLVSRPDFIVNNYLNGFRNYYPSPGKILLVGLTIAGLHLAFVNTKILGLTLDLKEISTQIAFFLFFIPVLATVSKLAFLRKTDSFIRHWISAIYLLSAYLIILTLLGDLLYWIWDFDIGAGMGMLFLLLFFIEDARVHTKGGTKKIALNAFLEVLVFLLASALVLFLNYLAHPEIFNGGQ